MISNEIMQELQTNFTRENLIQFYRKEAIDLLSPKFGDEMARRAVTELFCMFQPGMGTDDKFPAVIDLSEINDAIDILNRIE